jgi:hypothetical protein
MSPAFQDNSAQARIAEFQFCKRGQLLIGVDNETLSVAACITYEDCSLGNLVLATEPQLQTASLLY